jgi:quercetin dioxygenase-like cupin family protein
MSELQLPKGTSFEQLGRALAECSVEHHFGGGVYAKSVYMPKGSILVQHKHVHDHLSILASGKIILDVDGEHRELVGPCVIEVKAGVHHGVKAESDAMWYCIHAADVAEDGPLIANRQDVSGIPEVHRRLQCHSSTQ